MSVSYEDRCTLIAENAVSAELQALIDQAYDTNDQAVVVNGVAINRAAVDMGLYDAFSVDLSAPNDRTLAIDLTTIASDRRSAATTTNFQRLKTASHKEVQIELQRGILIAIRSVLDKDVTDLESAELCVRDGTQTEFDRIARTTKLSAVMCTTGCAVGSFAYTEYLLTPEPSNKAQLIISGALGAFGLAQAVRSGYQDKKQAKQQGLHPYIGDYPAFVRFNDKN